MAKDKKGETLVVEAPITGKVFAMDGPRYRVVVYRIRGTTPYVPNRFSKWHADRLTGRSGRGCQA